MPEEIKECYVITSRKSHQQRSYDNIYGVFEDKELATSYCELLAHENPEIIFSIFGTYFFGNGEGSDE